MAPEHLDLTLASLQEQLDAAEERVARLRRAIVAVRDVRELGGGFAAQGILRVEGQASLGLPSRPGLREAIPHLMREFPDKEWTVQAMAEALARRGWIGGKEGKPSTATAREVMVMLRRNGVLESRIDDRSKRAFYMLANRLLPIAPGSTEVVGIAYSDGREVHIVRTGEQTTACGEWAAGDPPLNDEVDYALPVCRACERAVQWWPEGRHPCPSCHRLIDIERVSHEGHCVECGHPFSNREMRTFGRS